ncbi:hypothetical protein [Allorhizocola rhizosphaerae]|uniref:hypothetical protein n=1 Tax=Allorhizocola rhizosphaerae TaxID=1872709 RepID=UPI0013C35E59|nr:hypothetical protein [Allorhizocola rhizosphaerae]
MARIWPDRSTLRELNGLRDDCGGLRVIGAASLAGGVLRLIPSPTLGDELTNRIKQQARALPPDARDIHPASAITPAVSRR